MHEQTISANGTYDCAATITGAAIDLYPGIVTATDGRYAIFEPTPYFRVVEPSFADTYIHGITKSWTEQLFWDRYGREREWRKMPIVINGSAEYFKEL